MYKIPMKTMTMFSKVHETGLIYCYCSHPYLPQAIDLFVCLFVCWCLMSLSTLFQLYHGGQFYWWKKPEKTSTGRAIYKNSLVHFWRKKTIHMLTNKSPLFSFEIVYTTEKHCQLIEENRRKAILLWHFSFLTPKHF
jgi:hypothetical protein